MGQPLPERLFHNFAQRFAFPLGLPLRPHEHIVGNINGCFHLGAHIITAFMLGRLGPLVLLTRDGCANTAVMLPRVEAVLQAMNPPPELRLVNLDSLPENDVRRGYPTPTLLYADTDVFGLPEPQPPLPAPT